MSKVKFPHKGKLPGKAAAFSTTTKIKRAPHIQGNRSSLRYQSRMQELEAEIALLTSYSSDTIYRLRYDTMTYDYVSPAVERLLGFSTEEIRRVNFRSLIVETKIITDGIKMVNGFDDLEAQRRKGDVSKWQADYLIRTRDGRKIWVSDVSYPWFDETGKIIGSVGSLHDITDRVLAEQNTREELTKIAGTDALTNLSNRRIFFNELDKELKRIRRSGNEVSMLLVDIDHFKKINDGYGHDVGDKVLIEIGKILLSCVRETDMVARLGGEEFGVLLPDTTLQGGFWVAERIRTTILKHEFVTGYDHPPIGCSVSIGVSHADPDQNRISSDLYKMADTRLYIAKNTGRNQVSIDEIVQMH